MSGMNAQTASLENLDSALAAHRASKHSGGQLEFSCTIHSPLVVGDRRRILYPAEIRLGIAFILYLPANPLGLCGFGGPPVADFIAMVSQISLQLCGRQAHRDFQEPDYRYS